MERQQMEWRLETGAKVGWTVYNHLWKEIGRPRGTALEKEMATHSSVLAWRIPGKGDPGGLPSLGSHRVGHDWSDLAAAAAAGCHRALVWAPWVIEQIPTGYLCICFRATLFVRSTHSFPCCVRKSLLHVCISTAALQMNSSVPFF